jgi:transcriptional regulator GlxA family with amidase domain
MIVEGTDVFWERVQEILREATESTIGARIAAMVAPSVPPKLRDVIVWSACEARHDISVRDMVNQAGVSERTLERHLQEALRLSPKDLIWWCRLLHALDARPRCRSWEDVAGRLGFSGGGQVRRMILKSARANVRVPPCIEALVGPLRHDLAARARRRSAPAG